VRALNRGDPEEAEPVRKAQLRQLAGLVTAVGTTEAETIRGDFAAP